MTIESISILLIVATLVGGLSYMVARSQGKQALGESEKALSAMGAEKDQLDLLLTNTAEQKEALLSRVSQLELDNGKIQTSLASSAERKGELVSELEQTKSDKNQALERMHEAEKQKEAMQAELKERRNQEQYLLQRLQNREEALEAERQALDKSKSNNNEISEKSKAFEITSQEAHKNLITRQEQLKTQESKLDSLQEKFDSLNRQYTELKTMQDEREASHAREVAAFERQKTDLKTEFKVVSEEIIKQRQETLNAQNKEGVGALLKPLQEQLSSFQNRINEVHDVSVRGNTHLNSEIRKVLDVGLRMSDEASSLATALKGDKKALGTWSEVQAELLLQLAGLREGYEYEREANFKTEDGKNQRPDFIINLPNGKHLIVDSKMSLNSYVEATSAENEEQRDFHLKLHVNSIIRHITSLSEKNYTKCIGLNTPEFVFMFIGNEPAYLAALGKEPNLAQGAYKKGIAIVTSSTLLSSLRIVTHLWSINKQNNNTLQLAEQASKVYDKLRVFVDKMEKLGNQINTVQNTYLESWKTLKDGNGSLTKQAGKFVDMGVVVKEKLASHLTEDDGIEMKTPTANPSLQIS
jgi:DNA recombination protein RmuC